jgi:hypothetical protein
MWPPPLAQWSNDHVRTALTFVQTIIAALALFLVLVGYDKIKPIIVHQLGEIRKQEDAAKKTKEIEAASSLIRDVLRWWNNRNELAQRILDEFDRANERSTTFRVTVTQSDSVRMLTILALRGDQTFVVFPFDVSENVSSPGQYLIHSARTGPYLSFTADDRRGEEVLRKVIKFVEDDTYLLKVRLTVDRSPEKIDQVIEQLAPWFRNEPYLSSRAAVSASFKKLDVEIQQMLR